MASGGPKIILTPEDIASFEKIMVAPNRQELMKALPIAEKRKLSAYIQTLQALKKVERLEADVSKLDEREAALMHHDKVILVQASSSYAPKAGGVTDTQPGMTVPKSNRFGY